MFPNSARGWHLGRRWAREAADRANEERELSECKALKKTTVSDRWLTSKLYSALITARIYASASFRVGKLAIRS
jgi:hypothetical protein